MLGITVDAHVRRDAAARHRGLPRRRRHAAAGERRASRSTGCATRTHVDACSRRRCAPARWCSARAGLLNGLTATTHWACYHELEATGAIPTAERVVEHLDQRIITAAGVSSGIDMALRLVELLVDRTAAKATQLMIEYDPQPPFDCGAWPRCDDADRDPSDRVRQAAPVTRQVAGISSERRWRRTCRPGAARPRWLTSVSPYSAAEHALDHAAVDGADDRVLDGDVAERAVVVDDAQLVVALVGVRGEAVGGRARRRRPASPSAGCAGRRRGRAAGEPGGHRLRRTPGRPARPSPRPARGQHRQRLAQQRQHEVVAAHRDVE